MTALERLYNAAVVPVVVLDDAADAVPTAKALLAGGVDVIEIVRPESLDVTLIRFLIVGHIAPLFQ